MDTSTLKSQRLKLTYSFNSAISGKAPRHVDTIQGNEGKENPCGNACFGKAKLCVESSSRDLRPDANILLAPPIEIINIRQPSGLNERTRPNEKTGSIKTRERRGYLSGACSQSRKGPAFRFSALQILIKLIGFLNEKSKLTITESKLII